MSNDKLARIILVLLVALLAIVLLGNFRVLSW